MVSKVAVIALVAIVACPILLGYAMNLEQVTETDYKTSGDSTNVTPLLQNDVQYTDVNADVYQINTNFGTSEIKTYSSPINPVYNKISNVKTSIPYYQRFIPSSWGGGFDSAMSQYSEIDVLMNYTNTATNYIDGEFYVNGNLSFTVNRMVSYYYTADNKTLQYSYHPGAGSSISTGSHTFTGTLTGLNYNFHGSVTAEVVYGYVKSDTSTYIDVAEGFYFEEISAITPTVKLPDNTKLFTASINLDSITDANYTEVIKVSPDKGTALFYLQLNKTTVGGNVSWKMATSITGTFNDYTDLYYDSSRNDNTYQLYAEMSKEKTTSTHEKATVNGSMKYVGGWPTVIGVANPYISYDFSYSHIAPIANEMYNGIAGISVSDYNTRSTTMRMDNAFITGYEMPVISDKIYDPKTFKDNPSTTINNVVKYGSSLTFGGNTYTVNKGNITIDGHNIPVDGLVLSSVPNDNGGFDNKIGNTVISSSAQPSTITFNGKWNASIATSSMESTTYTKTEWVAGSFGWDGLDHNFLIVGLLTSLGAFIALGIYMRRSKASIWPLIIVCGGAAVLFFIML